MHNSEFLSDGSSCGAFIISGIVFLISSLAGNFTLILLIQSSDLSNCVILFVLTISSCLLAPNLSMVGSFTPIHSTGLSSGCSCSSAVSCVVSPIYICLGCRSTVNYSLYINIYLASYTLYKDNKFIILVPD